ncbi:MAG: hypothetical protein VX185_00640 [Pseudomonadota bacterium]|nr:hypothetical protein [Pseudomonadota bacterium]
MMKDITPESFACHTADCCPAVYETENNSYVIVGKKLNDKQHAAIAAKVGEDEYVIEVPKEMIDQLMTQA